MKKFNKDKITDITAGFLAAILLIGLVVAVILLTGCVSKEEALSDAIRDLESQKSELKYEIIQLKDEKAKLQYEVGEIKVQQGTAKYIVTIGIAQKHLPFDFENNWKDEMNKITIDIPTDKEFYDSVNIGDVFDDSFRAGSFVFGNSVGSWNITIEDKNIE